MLHEREESLMCAECGDEFALQVGIEQDEASDKVLCFMKFSPQPIVD